MAVVNAESHKGEDFWTHQIVGAVNGFAVFDGHGGKDCARQCASEESDGVLPRLLAGSTLPTATEIADAFWDMDAKCGAALAARGGHGREGGGAHAGSTSNILFVEALEPRKSKQAAAIVPSSDPARPSGFRCIWAWTGDSTGITVDMSAGKLGPCTANHIPDNPVEASNLRLLEAVGKIVLKGKGKKAKRTEETGEAGTTGEPVEGEEEEDGEEAETPLTLAEVTAAMKKARMQATPTCSPELILKALERERLIAHVIPKGRKYRRNAVMQRRPRAKDENEPMVVATHEDPYSSHYRDLLMTRSICDWTKSCWVLPQPETLEFTIKGRERIRVVLASDGLWDICTPERAAAIVFKAATLQQAAEELLQIAKDVYQGERGLEKMGDDTTVMVLEMNPAGVQSRGEPKQGGCIVA